MTQKIESMTQKTDTADTNKVTVQEASRALSIGRKTIYRWIGKGLLSKVMEGNKTYVLLSEVRALCDRTQDTDTKIESENVTDTGLDTKQDTADTRPDTKTVIVDRVHYDGLLVRLGQYEAERRYLLEYKSGLEAQSKELTETKSTLAKANNELKRLLQLQQEAERRAEALRASQEEIDRLKGELDRARAPWYRKLFRKR